MDKLPAYSLKTVFADRDNLYRRFKTRYLGLELNSELLETLLEEIRAVFPKTLDATVLRETLRQHLGLTLEAPFFMDLAWRLAGNVTALRTGRPAISWKSPGTLEWVPMQVLRVDPAPKYKGEHQALLRLRILAGSACPLIIQKRFARRSLAAIASIVGFTSSRNGRGFGYSQEFTNLRFYGKLDPTLARFGMPGFFEIRCPPSCHESNLQILRLRFRQGGNVCPRNYTHSCVECPIGFKECPGGTHPETFVTLMCNLCHKPAVCDPALSLEKCRACCIRELLSVS